MPSDRDLEASAPTSRSAAGHRGLSDSRLGSGKRSLRYSGLLPVRASALLLSIARAPTTAPAPTVAVIAVAPEGVAPVEDETPASRPSVITPAARQLVGIWEDPETMDRTRFTIVLDAGEPVVISAIGSDGDREEMELQQSDWDGSNLTWTYLVPSTGYVVTFTTMSAEPEVLHTSWHNSANASGHTDLQRIGDAFGARPRDTTAP